METKRLGKSECFEDERKFANFCDIQFGLA